MGIVFVSFVSQTANIFLSSTEYEVRKDKQKKAVVKRSSDFTFSALWTVKIALLAKKEDNLNKTFRSSSICVTTKDTLSFFPTVRLS